MKLLTFSTSNSKFSINQKLIELSLKLLTTEVSINRIDINDFEMPIYSIDRENEQGIPKEAIQFYKLISEADALVIAFAEHNGSYTAAYKNIFDWVSRYEMKLFQNKPMILLATSPGKGGAKNVLNTATTATPYFGGKVIASLSLPLFPQNVDKDMQTITNIEFKEQFQEAFQQLEKFLKEEKGN